MVTSSLRNLQGHSGIEAVAGAPDSSEVKRVDLEMLVGNKMQLKHGPGQEELWWDRQDLCRGR